MAPQESTIPNPVSREAIVSAVGALIKWREKKSETLKPQLLEQDELLYLILTLKQIPTQTQTKPVKLPLPHPLCDPVNDGSEICLIYDDRPKSSLTKDLVKRKVDEDKIPIAKILKLSKLKSDFRPFEAKRKLCDSYDMFFADRRVIPLLPKMLGKQFFKKRKIPVALNLEHRNWKEQVELACSSAMLYLRTGTCCVIKVGRLSMGEEKLVENVDAAISGAGEAVARKWGNVRSLHLKLADSLALPLYQTFPEVKYKIDNGREEEKHEEVEADDTEVEKKVSKKKGRISEVMYLEDNKADRRDDSDDEFTLVDGDDPLRSKKRVKVKANGTIKAKKGGSILSKKLKTGK